MNNKTKIGHVQEIWGRRVKIQHNTWENKGKNSCQKREK